ncbi:MAG: hydrogenase formation protein HypD [Verrucomicrobiales bacterium]|nr:hydrogenase formation protein HypD [Verrucomicrobiales bacterium]
MRFVAEYRDPELAGRLVAEIARATTRPWAIMEVCGGQTHSIVRHGIDALLPPGLELIHGPGCPVCVTPMGIIDAAHSIARRKGVLFCSFGDMLRVPGTRGDLQTAKSEGADVRMVYSPLDAVALAARHPDREVVFFGVGFETTAPATALAVLQAEARGLSNFSLLVSHVRVPPALERLLTAEGCRVRGFLAAGHVCTVMGTGEYGDIAAKYRVPVVVTGFEPIDILQGILRCVLQLEAGRFEVENQYPRAVQSAGNREARDRMEAVFEVVSRDWRGVGEIASGGLGLRSRYAAFDAARRFDVRVEGAVAESECRSGEVLQGRIKPTACAAFGVRCTPERPLGATMVSSEGACAAYYRYRREEVAS